MNTEMHLHIGSVTKTFTATAILMLIDRNLASALVDRLMHHAHVVVTEGDSIRLADATGGKGVQPLTH